ncbi:TonB-dependent receptor domain-containing protein [Kaistella montana]|uniref:TonB-dependent receptor domain-containing protein n=1 Tax=Kaistella montana TaxID=1849733 RepID=A0ABW5KB14_9FLAO|nr:TonB-dependent receptor [Kaistella montana]MCQ4035736.1 TonB-dependent receptor [Kaistella montana]
MKTFLKSLVAFSLLFSNILLAQTITKATFKVKGNCGMCKERIETTAIKTGANSALWSAETQQLTVEYDVAKTNPDELLKKIAEVGHDNEKFTASNEVYNALPSCCHYEREPSFLKSAENTTKTKAENQFFVRGNCSSCKARIEKAAKTAGANSADWNAETQIVTLDFDPAKISADAILKMIANVGHDNEKYKASDNVYKNLPDCCLYDRSLPFGEKSDLVHHDESAAPKKDFTQHADHVDKNIDEIKLIKLGEATTLNKKETGLTFNISSKELLKAACCNLSESFETNATVDVAFSNAVTGTKQLKMLGLDQKYTSLTKELLPSIRGLASPYGMNLIPGRWIGGIQLTKGGSTVTNGYESITGQINTELLKFNEKPETALNFFGDLNGRFETNITSTSAISEHWNQSILLHGNATLAKMDTNDDGFLDQPTGNQINASYLLNYNDLEHSGLGTHFGISFVKDERFGGQKDFDKNISQAQQSLYGVGIDISKFDIWNKTGYVFKGKPYQSIGWMNQFTYHQQDSFFGNRNYLGKEKTFYSNLIFESIIGNTNHKYKAGASFLYDDFDEDYLTQNYKRTETVPGLFFEYTLTGLKYTLVAGARTDFHNLAGTQFTPRLNFKYDVTPKTILRLSAGKGFRTANIFAENQQYFASNRQIEIIGNGGKIYDLKPEIAWNYGASLQQEFKIFNRKATLVADFFRTDFQDQVLADLDISPNKIVFYNLDGKSFANSFQTQLDFVPAKNLELRLAYKYYDVQADFAGGKRAIPFMAKNRGFLNVAYSTDKNSKGGFWNFDTTLQLVGKQKLPNLNSNPTEFRLPEYSDSFATLNAQISRNFNKNIRVYLGGENLTSYTQNQPIIDAKNPFGNYFDGGMVYAPIMPANFYMGVDFSFN